MTRLRTILDAVGWEYTTARERHAPMHSAHEGYAVILEELDEMWQEVKQQHQDIGAMRNEAIQVAAMAVAFVMEVCDTEEERP